MSLPRVRFTVRGMMVIVALLSTLLLWAARWRREIPAANPWQIGVGTGMSQSPAEGQEPKRPRSPEPLVLQRREPPVLPRVEAPYIAITNVHPGDAYAALRKGPKPPSGPITLLRVELKDDGSAFLADLYDLNRRCFADDTWSSFGPDSSYREIIFFSRGRKVVLRSWHPLYEKNPGVVASSHGLVPLVGSREGFLRHDDQAYVEKRRTFDKIEGELRKQYGDQPGDFADPIHRGKRNS